MTLRLEVDVRRWRDHLTATRDATPGLVPVAKGNGYGFGLTRLADETAALGLDVLAVGTHAELQAVASFPGSRLVLTPWRPFVAVDTSDVSVVHTVSRVADLAELAARPHRPRVVVEVATSMRRHGIDVTELPACAPLLREVQFEGWTVHLPLTGDTTGEAAALARAARAVAEGTVWVSHVPPDQLNDVGSDVRSRVGTNLWLGDEGAVAARSHVLDVHPLSRGETFGYRQRTMRRTGTLLVVSGGTAHGIALSAPTPATTLRQRGIAAVDGGLEALGLARSPFMLDGKTCWFAEPPHMQCSMVLVPSGVSVPAVGDDIAVRIRHTTTMVDEVVDR
jgi:alanine racemase